jgi:hypothetical protein
MKRIYNKIGAIVRLHGVSGMIAVLFAALFTTGCTDSNTYDKEMYHPVISLLSEGGHNIYGVVIPFKESSPKVYISVVCGGSKPNPEEVTVTLERDNDDWFYYVNRANFDIDSAKYYLLFPKDKYTIPSWTVTLPANSSDPYANVEVQVDVQGLSPDSTYFIPIAIKSVSRYEANPDKSNMLLRISVINDYAEHLPATTVYTMKGTTTSGATVTAVSVSKIVRPLSADEIRFYAGIQTETNSSTVEEIAKYSIVAKINPDNSVSLRPYGTMELEMLEQEGYNRYYTQYDELTGRDVQYMDLYYRYRTLRTPAIGEDPAVWDNWIEIREMMQRTNYPAVIK